MQRSNSERLEPSGQPLHATSRSPCPPPCASEVISPRQRRRSLLRIKLARAVSFWSDDENFGARSCSRACVRACGSVLPITSRWRWRWRSSSAITRSSLQLVSAQPDLQRMVAIRVVGMLERCLELTPRGRPNTAARRIHLALTLQDIDLCLAWIA